MKTKLTIISKKEWKKTNDLTGEEFVKYFYGAFNDKSKPLQFSSENPNLVVNKGMMGYDAAKSIEVDLEAVFDSFKNQLKYQEVSE